MEQLGKLAECGFTRVELEAAKGRLGEGAELHDLRELLDADTRSQIDDDSACLLVGRDCVNKLSQETNADSAEAEAKALEPDKKEWMRGGVKNLQMRYKLTFGEAAQVDNFEEKKGAVVPFFSLPETSKLRTAIAEFFGDKAESLLAELNVYFNIHRANCSIGYHGDTERRIVIGLRFGATMSLCFQWFHRYKPASGRFKVELQHGDLYAFGAKAVGTDWKSSSKYTLRHAAGVEKVTTWVAKKEKK